jgi:hypothetical protein
MPIQFLTTFSSFETEYFRLDVNVIKNVNSTKTDNILKPLLHQFFILLLNEENFIKQKQKLEL